MINTDLVMSAILIGKLFTIQSASLCVYVPVVSRSETGQWLRQLHTTKSRNTSNQFLLQNIIENNVRFFNQKHIPQKYSTFMRAVSTNTPFDQQGNERKPDNQLDPVKQGVWRKAVNIIKSFVNGMKQLISDVKKVRQIKRENGGFKLSGTSPLIKPGDKVTLDGVRFMYKTMADLKRTLPAIVLFWIPLVGYVAPFLALLFPGQLLSSHFWSKQQKEQFFSRGVQRRRENLKKLNEYLSKSDNDFDKKILDITRQISNQDLRSELGIQLEDKKFKDGLQSLSRQHLNLLSHSWGVTTLIPSKWWTTRKLQKHIHYIYTCDYLLIKNGIDELNPNTVKELVLERYSSLGDGSDHESVLHQWIEMASLSKDAEILIGHMTLTHPIIDE